MRATLAALCTAMALAAAGPAQALELMGEEEDFELKADIVSHEGPDTIYAIGNVYLRRGDSSVAADAAVVWLAQKEAYLEGHVVYRFGASVIKSEKAYVHWSEVTDPATGGTSSELDKGLLLRGDVRWHEKPDAVPWHVRGDEILQTDVRTFIARGHAFFSSNLYHRPHTYFRAKEIELVAEESLSATHVTYNVQGVGLPPNLQGWWIPPTYWPKLYVPLGWQLPEMEFEFASSSRWGTYVRSLVTYELPPTFIPLVESRAGVQLDYMSERGYAYGGFFDYDFEEALGGKLEYYRVPDDSGEDRKDFALGTTDRYRLKYEHSQDLPEGWEFDFEYQRHSDAGFRQEYFRSDYKRDKPIENRAYLKYSQGPMAAYAHYRWRGMEWLDTTEYLPQVGANLFSYPVWGNLLYTGHVEVANVRRRLSDLRLPHCTVFVDPDPSDAEILEALGEEPEEDPDEEGELTEEQEALLEENRDRVIFIQEPSDIEDRDDIADPRYRRLARKRNFIQRPLRNSFQEDLSGGRRFWRFNTYHELAYPFAAGIFQVDPYVGARFTLYEETLMRTSPEWRSIVVGGTRVSTQFWRSWEEAHADSLRLFGTKVLPLEVNGLRHVVTPEVRLQALGVSSVEPNELILTDDTDIHQPIADPDYDVPFRPYQPHDTTGLAFGDVDYIHPVTMASFGLRNRWQTRRGLLQERIVDFIDLDIFLDLYTHDDRSLLLDDECVPPWEEEEEEDEEDEEDEEEEPIIVGDLVEPGSRRFGEGEDFADLRLDFRFNPIDGIHFYADALYSLTNDDAPSDGEFHKFNTGLLIATSDKWQLYLSQRYEVGDENRIGGRLMYHISKKWHIATGYTYRTNRSEPVDVYLLIVRDLHDWVAEFVIDDDREADEKVVGFRLRPKMLKQLVRGVEYERELTDTLEDFRDDAYEHYDY
ncbi:MAG: LPS assembly protein LptD [Candidatus Brocadiia bacterium]